MSFTVTWRPISSIRKTAIASISSAGQPWKVESVTWSERAVRKSRSRRRRSSSGISRRSASTSARASFIDAIQDRTAGERIAGEVVAHAQVEDVLVAGGVVRPAEQALRPRHVDQHRALHVLARGSPRGAAPGSTPRCSPRSPCRCRAAGSSGGRSTCTVFSSMKRPPASHDSRTFWAICPWGPAAGPTGLAARWPWTTTESVEVVRPAPEAPRRQVEDLLLALRLPQHPPQQVREGRRDELGHARTSGRMIATPRGPPPGRMPERFLSTLDKSFERLLLALRAEPPAQT